MSHHEGFLPEDWVEPLGDELENAYWRELLKFLAAERADPDKVVYPAASDTFKAFELTPYDDVKVVILGQDPYPNEGQAHGLAFSVPYGVKRPPSLRNIHAVLERDLNVKAPDHGNLEAWANEGVLLLNTALTVRAGSKENRRVHLRWRHQGHGWHTFTNAVIEAVNRKREPVVFLLWGKDAQAKANLVDRPPHEVICSSHPSPFSARLGFLTSEPFSQANQFLGKEREVNWKRICDDA